MANPGGQSGNSSSPRGPIDWVYIVGGGLIILVALVFLAMGSRAVTNVIEVGKTVAKTAAVAA